MKFIPFYILLLLINYSKGQNSDFIANKQGKELIPYFTGPNSETLKKITIPTIDISGEKERHIIVAQGTEDVYHGHCSTVLLRDGKTMLVTWAVNHAGYLGPLSKSNDGGKTWKKIKTPLNWKEVKNTTPTIHRLTDSEGKERLFVFGGCDFPGNIQQSVSIDDGETWTPMITTGLVGECAPKSIISFNSGQKLLMWSDRRDPTNPNDKHPVVWQSASFDGGLTWEKEEIILIVPGQWAQPCVIASPDNKQLLMLMRENTRQYNSLYSLSNDEGKTWSNPKELPAALTGDRHTAHYLSDGRLIVTMRDRANESNTKGGHFVAWIGKFEDIINNSEGQYRIKLLDNGGKDCGYSGLNILPDNTIIATTYVKYNPDPIKHSVVSVRFKIEETDAKFKELLLKESN